MFLNEAEPNVIPFDALLYLTGECNYGGRVTDDKDRRLIKTLLDNYYNNEAARESAYKFAPLEEYFMPQANSYQEFVTFIQNLPQITSPEVFGFHTNADITKEINEVQILLNSLLACQSQAVSEIGNLDELLSKLIANIMEGFPLPYDIEEIMKIYPVVYSESMNTVLTQELGRFNKLIVIIRSTLKELSLAQQGKILLSPQLERASSTLLDGKVPELWMDRSYPSLKPLGSYVSDLKQRLQFF